MCSRRHLKLGAGVLVAAIAGSLSLAAATFGVTRPASGAIQVFITPSLSGHGGGSIVITGTIGDYGQGAKVNAAGQPDPKGTYQLAHLHHGTILLNAATLRTAIAIGTEQARRDIASCSLHGSTTATLPIVSGTGRYAGISGSIKVRFTFAEVAGRYVHGAKAGTCNLDRGPVSQWASIVGAGTVSFM